MLTIFANVVGVASQSSFHAEHGPLEICLLALWPCLYMEEFWSHRKWPTVLTLKVFSVSSSLFCLWRQLSIVVQTRGVRNREKPRMARPVIQQFSKKAIRAFYIGLDPIGKAKGLSTKTTLRGNKREQTTVKNSLWRHTFSLSLVVVILVGCVGCSKPDSGKIVDEADHLVFVPPGLEIDRKYPLAILLSPGADASSMIQVWKPLAEKYKWILVASKVFRNGVSPDAAFDKIVEFVRENHLNLPFDKTKIIASGFSGGGMGAHMMAFYYRELISGVIPNTGMIDDYFYTHAKDYPKGKLAVFLASPTDFRYQNMQKDQHFLDGLGWKTRFLEFNGGHRMAPVTTYEEAVLWFTEQWNESSK
jgi:predicted esterase